jgi:hypothetical protein
MSFLWLVNVPVRRGNEAKPVHESLFVEWRKALRLLHPVKAADNHVNPVHAPRASDLDASGSVSINNPGGSEAAATRDFCTIHEVKLDIAALRPVGPDLDSCLIRE